MIVAVLRRRFSVAPPSFGDFLGKYTRIEHQVKFISLVRDYFPGEEQRYAKLKIGQAEEFAKQFSKKYFTIRVNPYYYGDPLNALTKEIPLQWHGMKSYEYDSRRDQSPARLLASVICRCPVEDGSRIAVVEMFQEQLAATSDISWTDIPVPERGHTLQYVEKALKDSPWQGLLYTCQWLFSNTGNDWLDTTGAQPEWELETVKHLTEDWKAYQLIEKEMNTFNEWLKKDFKGRSIKILNYIDKLPKTLFEVFKEEK